MAELSMNKVVKRYGATQVVHGVDLDIKDGEFCVFVGPSGCGKSTLLRMIAGLEETSEGRMTIGPKDVTHFDPAERGVAMVFQTYALYPHMTVRENMSFGLKISGEDKTVIKEKVDKAGQILKLADYMDRKPKALSGGQRQRVAIGRAIVRQPDVFLFDEPLSNLDAELRVEMRVEIARLHKQLGATMIYVTHDQVEAMTMADKIVVLRAGRIEQVGAPVELYENPDNLFVAGFIGSPRMNFFDGEVIELGFHQVMVTVPRLGNVVVPVAVQSELRLGQPVTLGLRPEHFDPKGDVKVTLPIDVHENLGGVSYVYSNSDEADLPIIVELRGQRPPVGSDLEIGLNPEFALLFDPQSEERIR
ncbi:carbohydrate ABC transporter ATP-binding protein, CUT1 family (TC 3.A.1.1.-) [Epibacterium ulvae]|uniref:Carbohydrate ABC transporter ATP-binding protein, CUT1 family (TC 3.A.1.1.-) n=1 Tax=Epibacterium ulvae TaxID=1156985 RepID=A0A1G5RA37_9RHOB|nr:sn-glycerol-3-phosphate ABC transporter ATP-binding protein UgpC [Epibacterium ulvae]SCZ70917.1 carbohydrate ABC transporter ATP-binding protein, CUT1 family (TC 3.A.1.1.-) [Epibacterium ulvae]